MSKPTLYLMVGYPGAGKTTVSQTLADATGAKHLWADLERHKLFPNPTHSTQESNQLYERLNAAADYLLAQGKDVIFDTNFNFYADREKLREIARARGADTRVLWITTPVETARRRAVGTHMQRNGYMMSMSEEQFDAIVSKLESPRKNEKPIKIDNPKLDAEALLALVK